MPLDNKVQLITYVDRLSAGDFQGLQSLLLGPLDGLFGGVHVLPFFETIDGEDAGFDPKDHLTVDKRLGDWTDVRRLADQFDVMADLIINHVSADSPQFHDYLEKGDESKFAGMFLRFGDVFPGGATEQDLLDIYRPRPGLPFTRVNVPNKGSELLWTTFTPKQIDINVFHAEGESYVENIIDRFSKSGVNIIRLDAAGYAIKTAGASCFMTADTFQYIEDFTQKSKAVGIDVLVEIHSHYTQQIEIAKKVDKVYDFALPPLVLHTLYSGNSEPLKAWLRISPRNCITVLDTHDGIGIVDVAPAGKLAGLLNEQEIDSLVEGIHVRSGGESRQSTGTAANNLDIYQVNSTFYSALAKDDNDYLLSRLIQFIAPGIPQVYYVGLLAGENDMPLLEKTKVGRDVNRHYYSEDELASNIARPVVQHLFSLIRLRNGHPAFSGEFSLIDSPANQLCVTWRSEDALLAVDIDLSTRTFTITSSASGVEHVFKDWDALGAFTPVSQQDEINQRLQNV